jgi:hypothetical protein
MRLEVDFSQLKAAANRMGPELPNITLLPAQDPLVIRNRHAPTTPPPEYDIPSEGLVIDDMEQVATPGGLLEYQGQQILLYIQDHSYRVQQALMDGEKGRRFHVANCKTLEEMRQKGRFERYVVTKEHSGEYNISGVDSQTGKQIEGVANLKVCKNCLSYLNYEGYKTPGNSKIFHEFSLEIFFQTYESFFLYHPKRMSGTTEGYTSDWEKVSRYYRESKKFCCEKCKVDLSGHAQLLHVHHIDGVKPNNTQENLKALCADCHSKEPHHQHMSVSLHQRQLIASLRQEQKKANAKNWQQVFDLADPGLNGLLYRLSSQSSPIPVIGLDIKNEKNATVAKLDLAWPERKLGVSISLQDQEIAQSHGWRAFTVQNILDNPDRLITLL